MLVIGGAALAHYKADRKYSDVDVIVDPDTAKQRHGINFDRDTLSVKVGNIEYHNGDALNNRELLNCPWPTVYCEELNRVVSILTIPWLYAIKRSHIHRPLQFSKHLMDMLWLKSQCTSACLQTVASFIEHRKRLTYRHFGQNVPSLMKSNDAFFDDPVTKVYIHDDIHEVMAFEDEPMYKKLKNDQEKAYCVSTLWDNLTYTQKVQCVQEETMVIALERFIIPERTKSSRFAYLKALEKVCTTLTSGWFRDFAIDNYPACADLKVDYVSLFRRNEHKCRKHQQSSSTPSESKRHEMTMMNR